MDHTRKESDLPESIVHWGWRYHHLGVPTKEKKPGERYLPGLKFYVSGFETSPFGVEWMRFEPDSPMHPLIQRVPHLAFEVDDLDRELQRLPFHILQAPNSPAEGIRVAMIEHEGAPIELIEFRSSSSG